MVKDKRQFDTKSFFPHMLVTYGPLSHESIEADEATEESRLLSSNCYFLGVLKGVEKDIIPTSGGRSRLTFYRSHRHEVVAAATKARFYAFNVSGRATSAPLGIL